MPTKYDTQYCPCGCGNENDLNATMNIVESIRKKLDNKRYCMQEGTGYIALLTLEEAKKQNSRPVEKFGLDEFLFDAETEHDKWAATSLYRIMTTSNAYANSEKNKIKR